MYGPSAWTRKLWSLRRGGISGESTVHYACTRSFFKGGCEKERNPPHSPKEQQECSHDQNTVMYLHITPTGRKNKDDGDVISLLFSSAGHIGSVFHPSFLGLFCADFEACHFSIQCIFPPSFDFSLRNIRKSCNNTYNM